MKEGFKMKNTSKIRRVTILAMLSALTILLAYIPQLGFITLGPLSITILHIPVLISAMLYGVFGGVFMGTVFGVSSWIISQIRGGVLDVLFFNPLISILPRVLFGLVAGLLAVIFLNKKISLKKYYFRVPIVGFVASMIHSLLVLFMIFFVTMEHSFNPIKMITEFFAFFVIFLGQAGLEALGAAIILLVLARVLINISDLR